MPFFYLVVRLLCIICCIVAVTSYRIDHDPSFDERNERAVTEWRFRRNYLFKFPYFFQNQPKNNPLVDNEANDNHQAGDEIKSNEKRFIIPELMFARMRD